MTTTLEPKTQPWACPDSRTVLRYDASREEWLRKRMDGVGGSEFGILLGAAPQTWGTRHDLWMIKTGQKGDKQASAFMERGADIEPIILRKFSEKTGLATRRAGLQRSKKLPRMQYSPDAFIEDGRLLEAKLVSRYGQDKWVDEASGLLRPPDHVDWQGRYGCAVTGKPACVVVAMDVDTWEIETFDVDAQPGDFEFAADTVSTFWNYVANIEPPPVDYLSANPSEMLHRYPVTTPDTRVQADIPEQALADWKAYREIVALEGAGRGRKKEKEGIKTRIQMELGDNEYLVVDGVELFRWRDIKNDHFDEDAFKAAHPGLYEEFFVHGTTRRFEAVKKP